MHLEVHFEMLAGMVESYDREDVEADVEGILRTFSAALPHVKEHIDFLAPDETRKDIVKKATNMLKELVIFYRRVERDAQETMAEQQRLAQQRQQAVIEEMQNEMRGDMAVKMREVELKAQIEAMKQESIAQVRAAKTEAQNAIRAQGADMKANLDREIAERKLALEEEIARRRQDMAERTSG